MITGRNHSHGPEEHATLTRKAEWYRAQDDDKNVLLDRDYEFPHRTEGEYANPPLITSTFTVASGTGKLVTIFEWQ